MENYQCHLSINNRAHDHLRLLKSDLDWGVFRDGPVTDIPPLTEVKAFVATGATGPAGTEGTVVYQIGDDANTTVSVYFDVPTRPLSHNTVRADSSNPDVAAQVTGFDGSGSTESCTVKVIDGRS